jgi:hypothetical protein
VHTASPPPACRADRVGWTLEAEGGGQGLQISLGVDARSACRLPARPRVEVLLGGRVVAGLRPRPYALGGEYAPAARVAPGSGAVAYLRWTGFCGPRHGPLVLRLTLGGVSVVRALPGAAPPACTPGGRLLVSRFVRR